MLTFFTLASDYRTYVFTQIHEIVFYGKGGYDWETVYNMPLWLRRFTYRAIIEHYESEKKAADKAANKTTLENKKQVMAKPPTNVPSYTAKASKK